MPKTNPLSYEEVARALVYDAATGVLTWRINVSRNIKAGSSAGCPKGVRFNKKTGWVRYLYVRLNNVETPAARVAWLLHYGEWPKGNLLFKDGDTTNLRIANLKEGATYNVTTSADGLKSRKMTKVAQRRYGLKRFYGITVEEYGAMLAAQGGVCAICGKPETAMFNGKPKVMHVDHDHTTDVVRALLCGRCNGGLGLFGDDPTTLRAAADYIEKHRKKVVPFKAPKEIAP